MRILIADDDRVSRIAVEELFSTRHAAELVSVDSGNAAWTALREDPRFDLLCLDVRMPAPDGIELANRIRNTPELEQLPIVLITSASDRDTVVSATRAQVQGFIVKPVADETVERIARVLAAFEATVLEPQEMAVSRLGIDAARYAKYLEALCLQVRALAQQSERLGDDALTLAFQHKCGTCRTAALALGARRIERLLGEAMREASEAPERSAALMRLASYWLERVRRDRSTPATV